MTLQQRVRSLMVTPATRIQEFRAGTAFGADVTLADFEDGVSENDKEQARRNWMSFRSSEFSSPVAVRINSIRTRNGLKDVLTILESPLVPSVLVMPKVEDPAEVEIVDELLSKADSPTRIWAILENSKGVENARAIAACSSRLSAISFGMADFSVEVGATMEWEPMLYARAQVVMAAGRTGIAAIDAPTFCLSNEALLREESQKARDMGFCGKVAIHPKQVPIINEIFGASAEMKLWAKRVVDTFEASQEAIAVVDGVMVGPPALQVARSILTKFRGSSNA